MHLDLIMKAAINWVRERERKCIKHKGPYLVLCWQLNSGNIGKNVVTRFNITQFIYFKLRLLLLNEIVLKKSMNSCLKCNSQTLL